MPQSHARAALAVPMPEYCHIPAEALPFDSTVYNIALLPPPVADTLPVAAEVPPPPPAWLDGIQGKPRHINAGDDSGVLVVVASLVVVMMLCFRSCRHLFGALVQELLSVRRRENAFDEHTSNEARLLLLMAVQWSLCTGLLLYSFLVSYCGVSADATFRKVMICSGVTAVYYCVQYSAYWVVGYAFGSPEQRRLYLQGFTASQSLLGFALLVPALVSIFYPEGVDVILPIGASLYAVARIIFIIKGFRIFYHNFSSLLYFILYLCTLEILPIVYIYKIALLLVDIARF